jgi:hypothetical protein
MSTTVVTDAVHLSPKVHQKKFMQFQLQRTSVWFSYRARLPRCERVLVDSATVIRHAPDQTRHGHDGIAQDGIQSGQARLRSGPDERVLETGVRGGEKKV